MQIFQDPTQQIVHDENDKCKLYDNYQLIEEGTQKSEYYTLITFNKDQTIMLASCSRKIRVFQFVSGILNEIQQLEGHKSIVNALHFQNDSNRFISGGYDSLIIIWCQNQKGRWQCEQLYEFEPRDNIIKLKVNATGDVLIISGQISIQFWRKVNSFWETTQIFMKEKKNIRNIAFWYYSMNESLNQIVSVGDHYELVIQDLKQNKWVKRQIIENSQPPSELCYMTDYVILVCLSGIIKLLKLNESNLLFEYQNEICFSSDKFHLSQAELFFLINSMQVFPDSMLPYFTPIFNKRKGILIIQIFDQLKILIITKTFEITLLQSIDFGNQEIFGRMTDDWEYLVTWDGSCDKIQVRKRQ